MQKKIIEEKIEREVFVAEDGCEFTSKRECEDHEAGIRFARLNQHHTRVPNLDCVAPLDYDDYYSEDSQFLWFDLKTKRDVRSLNSLIPNESAKLEKPGLVCVEEKHGEYYTYTYEGSVNFVRNYFEQFGFTVELEKKEEA